MKLLGHNEPLVIPEAKNHWFKVNESDQPFFPGCSYAYAGDFLTACAAVISADGQGMAEFRGARELTLGEVVAIGAAEPGPATVRHYRVERASEWDRHNVKLVPVNDAAVALAARLKAEDDAKLEARLAAAAEKHGPELPAEAEDAATICLWTDSHPATVIATNRSGRKKWVRRDTAVRADKNGQSESQTYRYFPNPSGMQMVFTLRQNGRWVQQGENQRSGTGLALGSRREYRDPSF